MISFMKKKNYLPPFIAALCLIAYYAFILILFLLVPSISVPIKLIICIIPAAICGVVIYVLVQRIKEIKSGEYDDLGKF